MFIINAMFANCQNYIDPIPLNKNLISLPRCIARSLPVVTRKKWQGDAEQALVEEVAERAVRIWAAAVGGPHFHPMHRQPAPLPNLLPLLAKNSPQCSKEWQEMQQQLLL